MGAIDKHIVEANVKLLDENSVLKDDKRILNLRVEEKDKVINDLLSKIAKLEYEVERQDNIINELEKELNKDFTTYLQKDTTMRETGKTYKAGANNYRMCIYLKLQKLKGSDKE